MIDPISSLGARIDGTAAPTADRARLGAAAPSAATGPSFGEVLEQVSTGAVESLRGAEAASIGVLQGRGSTLEVVEAIKSAEQALQTAIAVRDKVVQAYQEISRMTI